MESEQAGVLVRVEEGTLVDEASRCDTVLSLLVRVGDFVPQGMPLVTASTAARDLDQNRVRRALTQAQERTMEQDVAFGLRQLVDIAERALSPGVNDPTTAVQALDEIHDLLRRLAAAPNPAASVTDDEGQVRLVLRPFRFEDLLALGLDEIVHYGKDSVQVPPRVAAMLADLHSAARPEHRPAIEAYRDRVRSATSHPR